MQKLERLHLNTRSSWGLVIYKEINGGIMAAVYMRKDGEICISLFAKEPRIKRKDRGACGAKTRKGTQCKAPPVWDKENDVARNGRCKLHGGKSTGARTEKGREAIRESNRRRAKTKQSLLGE